MSEYDPRKLVNVDLCPHDLGVPPQNATDALKYHSREFRQHAAYLRERADEMGKLAKDCQNAIMADTALAGALEADAKKLDGLL